jgi:adenylate kinase family enzyme
MIIVLFGQPHSGKSTLADILVMTYLIPKLLMETVLEKYFKIKIIHEKVELKT